MGLSFYQTGISIYSGVTLPTTSLIQSALVTFLILGALFCAYFAIFSLKQRPGLNAWLVSALAVAIFTYSLGYSGEMLSSNLDSMLKFVRIEYLGLANLPALWLSLALFYTNHMQWLRPRRLLLIWIVPFVTLLAVSTNSFHHLYYVTATVSFSGPFPTLGFVRGPLYGLQVIYTYCAFLGATILLARKLRHSHLLYRKQITLMLIAGLVTIATTVLRLTFLSPIPGLDTVPFALIISCLIMGWGIMRYQLIGINPIARDVLFMYQMDGVLVVDDQNQLVDFNPAASEILNLPPDAIGQYLPTLLPEETRQVFENLAQHQTGLEIQTNHSGVRFFDITLSPLISKKRHFIGSLIVLHESTERKVAHLDLKRLNNELTESIRQLKATKQALQTSESHYRLLAENTNDVIWEMDLNGRFAYVSPSVERLRGFTPAEVMQQSFNEIVCRDSQSLIVDHIQIAIQMARSGQSIPLKFLEIEQPCKDGSTVWTEATAQLIFDERGEPSGFVGVSRNIMERKRAELQLKFDATHDGLTGLPNRVLFLDRLEKALQTNQNGSGPIFSVLFLDLDEFKIINDSLGHAYGDQLLKAIGNRLRNCLSSEDTVARLGGDEFVFLVENLQNIDEVNSIAARILEEIQQPYQLDEHRVFISASIGVIPSISGYKQSEHILRDADITMYRAKASGKARYEIFEPLLLNKAISRHKIESDLRRAVETDKFKLLYQPIFSLLTDEIVGFEALLRLNGPRMSMISPSEFIPIAEESGLIGPIGKWVLREACFQAKKWQEDYPQVKAFRISINISGKQFSQPNFVDQIKSVLKETGLNPNSLTLEITETVFIGNTSKAKSVFSSLFDLGVQLQIDDFGTGFSSLRYIKHYPVDTIKIDQSFVKEINLSDKDADLVHAIVLMAHSLGMETIAEGIENQDQLNELIRYGCHFGQGYLLSRPLDSRSVELLLEKTLSEARIRMH
jgi:diguanylate cyclase (GGDEF)-like protein/PAS domain S-box-containing protein